MNTVPIVLWTSLPGLGSRLCGYNLLEKAFNSRTVAGARYRPRLRIPQVQYSWWDAVYIPKFVYKISNENSSWPANSMFHCGWLICSVITYFWCLWESSPVISDTGVNRTQQYVRQDYFQNKSSLTIYAIAESQLIEIPTIAINSSHFSSASSLHCNSLWLC